MRSHVHSVWHNVSRRQWRRNCLATCLATVEPIALNAPLPNDILGVVFGKARMMASSWHPMMLVKLSLGQRKPNIPLGSGVVGKLGERSPLWHSCV